MTNRERLAYLLKQYAENACSRQELDELLFYLKDSRNKEAIHHLLGDEWNKDYRNLNLPEVDWENMFTGIVDPPILKEPRPAKVLWMRMAAAAIIILLFSSVAYLWYTRKPESELTKMEKPQQIHGDVLPGGNKAMLTLSNGTTIVLDSEKNGRIADQGNVTILKVNDGQLAYNVETGDSIEIIFNTITIPKGGQYKVVLGDGTRVWLNASSSLYYPAQFAGDIRKVKLTGEAYFEVEHNADRPFIVEVEGVEVKDLGTSFNINAYPDEHGIVTTLITGLANVKNAGNEVQLHPGKKATVSDNSITIGDADTEQAIAWKEGAFDFRGQDIAAIMRQVSRWYDVEVSFSNSNSKDTYSGMISRDRNLSEVLKVLEGGGLHFFIQGRKVIVTP